jgi:hypothetical protein
MQQAGGSRHDPLTQAGLGLPGMIFPQGYIGSAICRLEFLLSPPLVLRMSDWCATTVLVCFLVCWFNCACMPTAGQQ